MTPYTEMFHPAAETVPLQPPLLFVVPRAIAEGAAGCDGCCRRRQRLAELRTLSLPRRSPHCWRWSRLEMVLEVPAVGCAERTNIYAEVDGRKQ